MRAESSTYFPIRSSLTCVLALGTMARHERPPRTPGRRNRAQSSVFGGPSEGKQLGASGVEAAGQRGRKGPLGGGKGIREAPTRSQSRSGGAVRRSARNRICANRVLRAGQLEALDRSEEHR